MAETRVERRVVTALFVDIVGSTALTVALGPERLKHALDHAFGELAGIIAAEGGTVEKYPSVPSPFVQARRVRDAQL
jgi:class 3 adenylate cyclase